MVGKFELLVKVYEQGNMSAFLGSVAVGSTVEFKHIPFNVKTQYFFAARTSDGSRRRRGRATWRFRGDE